MIEYKKDWALLLLRLAFGGIMLVQHGLPKLTKLIAGAPFKFPDVLGMGNGTSLTLAVFAEVFCAALLVVGFKTRWAAIPLVVTMLVAAFVQHAADPFAKKELAIMYFIGYAVIYLLGPGRHSLDYHLRPKV